MLLGFNPWIISQTYMTQTVLVTEEPKIADKKRNANGAKKNKEKGAAKKNPYR